MEPVASRAESPALRGPRQAGDRRAGVVRRCVVLHRGGDAAQAPNNARFPRAASAAPSVADRCPGRRLHHGLDGSVRRIPGGLSAGRQDVQRADYRKQALLIARGDRSWSSVSRRDDRVPARSFGSGHRTEASAAYPSGVAEAKSSAPVVAAAPRAVERLELASPLEPEPEPRWPPLRERALELVGPRGSGPGSRALRLVGLPPQRALPLAPPARVLARGPVQEQERRPLQQALRRELAPAARAPVASPRRLRVRHGLAPRVRRPGVPAAAAPVR